jgi:hypothetical protein
LRLISSFYYSPCKPQTLVQGDAAITRHEIYTYDSIADG